MLRVFVYGTLKPGELYHESYCGTEGVAAIAAMTTGQIYHLSVGYPAMTVGDGWVIGMLLSFARPQVLQRLDQLEGFCRDRPAAENEYQRVWRPVWALDQTPLGEAWMYVMTTAQISALGGQPLPGGVWRSADF
ncbi:gamma-glutamylcyclotransferase family protein [Almyronema epifaneia]|uniref:Gamma-glutamylcyclotransferase n=1 Tax=Almyronema epifaneia S1 TaxID=2991925 RepID=A0ABW6IDW9_9CYAN